MGIVGPLPYSRGHRYIITCVDRFTRWPEAFPLEDITAESVARLFVSTWISRFGCPSTITTDRGRIFQCSFFAALTSLIGVRHVFTPACHPSAKAVVERLHRQLKDSSLLGARGNTGQITFPLRSWGIVIPCRKVFHGPQRNWFMEQLSVLPAICL